MIATCQRAPSSRHQRASIALDHLCHLLGRQEHPRLLEFRFGCVRASNVTTVTSSMQLAPRRLPGVETNTGRSRRVHCGAPRPMSSLAQRLNHDARLATEQAGPAAAQLALPAGESAFKPASQDCLISTSAFERISSSCIPKISVAPCTLEIMHACLHHLFPRLCTPPDTLPRTLHLTRSACQAEAHAGPTRLCLSLSAPALRFGVSLQGQHSCKPAQAHDRPVSCSWCCRVVLRLPKHGRRACGSGRGVHGCICLRVSPGRGQWTLGGDC